MERARYCTISWGFLFKCLRRVEFFSPKQALSYLAQNRNWVFLKTHKNALVSTWCRLLRKLPDNIVEIWPWSWRRYRPGRAGVWCMAWRTTSNFSRGCAENHTRGRVLVNGEKTYHFPEVEHISIVCKKRYHNLIALLWLRWHTFWCAFGQRHLKIWTITPYISLNCDF